MNETIEYVTTSSFEQDAVMGRFPLGSQCEWFAVHSPDRKHSYYTYKRDEDGTVSEVVPHLNARHALQEAIERAGWSFRIIEAPLRPPAPLVKEADPELERLLNEEEIIEKTAALSRLIRDFELPSDVVADLNTRRNIGWLQRNMRFQNSGLAVAEAEKLCRELLDLMPTS